MKVGDLSDAEFIAVVDGLISDPKADWRYHGEAFQPGIVVSKPVTAWEEVFALKTRAGTLVLRRSQPVQARERAEGGFALEDAGTPEYMAELRPLAWNPNELVDPEFSRPAARLRGAQEFLGGDRGYYGAETVDALRSIRLGAANAPVPAASAAFGIDELRDVPEDEAMVVETAGYFGRSAGKLLDPNSPESLYNSETYNSLEKIMAKAESFVQRTRGRNLYSGSHHADDEGSLADGGSNGDETDEQA